MVTCGEFVLAESLFALVATAALVAPAAHALQLRVTADGSAPQHPVD